MVLAGTCWLFLSCSPLHIPPQVCTISEGNPCINKMIFSAPDHVLEAHHMLKSPKWGRVYGCWFCAYIVRLKWPIEFWANHWRLLMSWSSKDVWVNSPLAVCNDHTGQCCIAKKRPTGHLSKNFRFRPKFQNQCSTKFLLNVTIGIFDFGLPKIWRPNSKLFPGKFGIWPPNFSRGENQKSQYSHTSIIRTLIIRGFLGQNLVPTTFSG